MAHIKLDRRQFALAAAGLAAGFGAPAGVWAQDANPAQAQAPWEQAVNKILGGATPTAGKIAIEIPEIAENGNTVPFSISLDSPMTEKDHVKAIHIVATGNPQPGVATFRFTLDSGKAAVSGRMRLGRTQDVIVIAELNEGRFLLNKRNVKVTIGGCGG